MKAVGVLLGVLALTAAAWAQPVSLPEGEHAEDLIEHKPRHGGYFGDAGDLYHYELVVEEAQQLRLYVYDENVRPLKVGSLPARWTLLAEDSSPEGSGRFAASAAGEFFWMTFKRPAAEVLHILVEVEKHGQWVPMEFYVPVSQRGLAVLTGQK